MKVQLAVIALAFASAVQAQHQHQPYAGEQLRDVKALSAQEIEQYLSGAGMGYARAAELNHYPGPAHVLELAEPLSLTSVQREATRLLMQRHRAQAKAIGAKRVASEQALEALFREGKADQAQLAAAVHAAASLEGDYRLSHLETHRQMRALLTDEQVARYDRLRGYAVAQATPPHGDQEGASLVDGVVRKVDKEAKKITIRHGPMPALDMPSAMTMVYQVKDAALLDRAKAGDKVKFEAEKIGGAFVVTKIEPVK